MRQLLHRQSPEGKVSRRRKLAVAGPVVVLTLALVAWGGPSAVAAASASATKSVAFTGQYSGKISVLIDNTGTSASAKITSVTGSGKATLIGASKVKGSGSTKTTSTECPIPFTGKGTLTGAKGKITFSVTESKSSGCSNGDSGAVKVTFSGVAVASGGTGVANGATGSIKFKGTVNLAGTSGPTSGSYKATFKGTLKVKG